MGSVKEQIKQVTNNEMALAIGEDIDNGMGMHEIIDKYAKTEEMKARIKETAQSVENHLKQGKSLKEVLDHHFDHEGVKGEIHKHHARIKEERSK
jgi:hypothetical protein